jgi:FdhD protein
MTETPRPSDVLDTEDAVCPLPVLLTREALKSLRTGQVLKVITHDPAAKSDIPVWAGRMGNEVLSVDERKDGQIVLYIQKGIVKAVSEQDEDVQMSSKLVKHFRVQLSDTGLKTVESEVTLEIPVYVRVNGLEVAVIMATPNRLDDLAVGYLLDEGIIDEMKQIRQLKVRGNKVDIETEKDVSDRVKEAERVQLITSECLSLEHYLRVTEMKNLPKVHASYQVDAEELSSLVLEFNREGRSGKHPGGIHSAALFEKGVLKHYVLDVSRHSAVDKVLGAGARDHVDFSQSIILTSGRQPASMVLKAARMNIPISASMRGPIYSGVLAAQKTGITLICYATANRFDIYSGTDRIRLPKQR